MQRCNFQFLSVRKAWGPALAPSDPSSTGARTRRLSGMGQAAPYLGLS